MTRPHAQAATPDYAMLLREALHADCRPLEQIQMLSPVNHFARRSRPSRSALMVGRPRRDRYYDHRQRKNHREPKSETIWWPCHLFPLMATNRNRRTMARRRRTVNAEPGPPKSSILPELCRTHLGLPDARAEFEPGIFVLLQCGALRSLALPGMQSREHDPKRLQGPRCEMQHKRQRHFAFVLRRWLTWFYPQVCHNQALSGASTFLFCPSISATASADC